MTYKKGDILKLSEEGLNHLYRWDKRRWKLASKWRFEYRCQTRNTPDCITAIRVGKGYYQCYHKDFLEKAGYLRGLLRWMRKEVVTIHLGSIML